MTSAWSAAAIAVATVAATAVVAGSAPRSCTQRDLALSVGPPVSPLTGEHAELLVLTNTSSAACRTGGFPAVALLQGRRALPFRYLHGGLGYVARLSPRPVVLRHRGHAYVLIAKYRCDGQVSARAGRVRLTFARPRVVLTAPLRGTGAHELDYCARYPGDLPVDPGNRVALTPIEPTLSRALTPPS